MSLFAARYFPDIPGQKAEPGTANAGETSGRVCAGWEREQGREQRGAEPVPGQERLTDPRSAAEPSDETLMALISEGDREALACLFRRYARIVRGLAYRVLRDPSEADDLLQDIFILIHNECTKFDSSRGPARFWILQMTYRRAISRRRYLNTRHFYTHSDLEEVERTYSNAADESGRYVESIEGVLGNGALGKMFAALSENQQRTLQLFFFEGYTLEEIAAKLNQTRGNIKNHYFRGLEKLRRSIFGKRQAPEL